MSLLEKACESIGGFLFPVMDKQETTFGRCEAKAPVNSRDGQELRCVYLLIKHQDWHMAVVKKEGDTYLYRWKDTPVEPCGKAYGSGFPDVFCTRLPGHDGMHESEDDTTYFSWNS